MHLEGEAVSGGGYPTGVSSFCRLIEVAAALHLWRAALPVGACNSQAWRDPSYSRLWSSSRPRVRSGLCQGPRCGQIPVGDALFPGSVGAVIISQLGRQCAASGWPSQPAPSC